MNPLERLSQWRSRIGKAAAFFFALCLLAALDGLVERMREPADLLELLPGESIQINGPLKENVPGPGALAYESSSDQIRVSFEAVHPGFWLGGTMWRGVLTADPRSEPGDYTVKVAPSGELPGKPSSSFRIKVYQDQESYRRGARSLFERTLGVSPWWALVVFLGLTGLSFGAVYLLSQKREWLLAQEGKAELYWIQKGESGWEVAFSLGTRDGIQSGMRLNLLNDCGLPIGTALVQGVSETDARATVESAAEEPQRGFLIAR